LFIHKNKTFRGRFSIEGSFLRVVIENKGEEIPIDIDLKKHLENKEIQ